jgi:hypothetical protein
MKRIFLLFVCLTISVVSFGQDKAASRDVTLEIPPGPSMDETKKWIKRELPLLGAYSIVRVKNDDRSKPLTTKYGVESAVLSDCLISIRRTEFTGEYIRLTYTETVTLKDVDISKIRAVEEPVARGYTYSRPSYAVSLIAAADRGEPFTSQMKQAEFPARAIKPTRSVHVRTGDKEGANLAADILRRVAVLCGAPSQPIGTAVVESAEKTEISPTKQASLTSPKLTNDEVIQLVTAGLSEQVIITSVRQAPTKDFDLTPTGLIALKKAGVSDAVIIVMQEKGTLVQTPSGNEAKTPPKYDATLAQPEKPPADNGCSGIESMGIYKNTAISAAIGGGVVEWLAKIRNNTAVTKIVVFGWRDMYGQQHSAQTQIRGGEIASVRLDLTQARVIPPVTDMRVLSCQ